MSVIQASTFSLSISFHLPSPVSKSNEHPKFLPSQEFHFIDLFIVIYGIINGGRGKDGGSTNWDQDICESNKAFA